MIGFNHQGQIKLTIGERSEKVRTLEQQVFVLESDCSFNSPELVSGNKINTKYDIWYRTRYKQNNL